MLGNEDAEPAFGVAATRNAVSTCKAIYRANLRAVLRVDTCVEGEERRFQRAREVARIMTLRTHRCEGTCRLFLDCLPPPPATQLRRSESGPHVLSSKVNNITWLCTSD